MFVYTDRYKTWLMSDLLLFIFSYEIFISWYLTGRLDNWTTGRPGTRGTPDKSNDDDGDYDEDGDNDDNGGIDDDYDDGGGGGNWVISNLPYFEHFQRLVI